MNPCSVLISGSDLITGNFQIDSGRVGGRLVVHFLIQITRQICESTVLTRLILVVILLLISQMLLIGALESVL
jgi:hypothetical protein